MEHRPLRILGIDPGPSIQGYALVNLESGLPVLEEAGQADHDQIALLMRRAMMAGSLECAVEFPCLYRMAKGQAGDSVLRTAEACGIIFHTFRQMTSQTDARVAYNEYTRPEVCNILLGTTRGVTKASMKARVRELWTYWHGLSGEDAVGTKKKPGPLFLMRLTKDYHHWDALELAACRIQLRNGKNLNLAYPSGLK